MRARQFPETMRNASPLATAFFRILRPTAVVEAANIATTPHKTTVRHEHDCYDYKAQRGIANSETTAHCAPWKKHFAPVWRGLDPRAGYGVEGDHAGFKKIHSGLHAALRIRLARGDGGVCDLPHSTAMITLARCCRSRTSALTSG